LSTFVELPVEHLAAEIDPPLGEAENDAEPDLFIFSSDKKPCDPFIAACYEGRWFRIEKSDFRSKRTLGSILILLALANTGAKDNLRLITTPAN
jgi:hypothetical protein